MGYKNLNLLKEINNDPVIKKLNVDSRSRYVIYDLFDEMANIYNNKEIIYSIKYNLDYHKKISDGFFLNKEKTIKCFKMSPLENIYRDSIIEHHIKLNQRTMAVFGFYFTVRNNVVTLRINNLKGFLDNVSLKDKKLLLKKTEAMDKNLKIKIVSFLRRYADKNKFKIKLELPKFDGKNKGEYLKQVKSYLNISFKAGLSLNQISMRRVEDLSVKRKIVGLFKNNKVLNKKSVLKKKPVEKVKIKRK